MLQGQRNIPLNKQSAWLSANVTNVSTFIYALYLIIMSINNVVYNN